VTFNSFQIGSQACYRQGHKLITSIQPAVWPKNTTLYNLVLSGSHTYYVDGYAVTGWAQNIDFNYDTWRPTGEVHNIPKKMRF
jgi:hypothetical protein